MSAAQVDRRDFLAGLLAALFLALFPWLRGERGAQVASDTAYAMLKEPAGLNFDLEAACAILKQRYSQSRVEDIWYRKSPFLAAIPKRRSA